jgi:CHAD domain/Ppx/GppA phosphatase family
LTACEMDADRVIRGAVEPLELPAGTETRLIVVGGTGEYLARLVPDARKIDLDNVRQVLSRMTTLPAAELAMEIAIPEARARVLPAGVAIVAAITQWMNPNRIEISQSGIRTGLLIDAVQPVADAVELEAPEHGLSGAIREVTVRENRWPRDGQQPGSDADFRDTMKTLIAERWDTLWRAIPIALQGTDIEGVHDVRVASRRLRAAMDIAAPVFPRGWYRPLHQAAKEITGALGEVRDRDVLLEALHADRKSAPLVEHPGIDRLIARVERERADARVEMERYLSNLLNGPLPSEIERRFKATAKSSDSRRSSTEGGV